MCSCQKYKDSGYYAGVENGILEVHSSDFCRTRHHMAGRWTRFWHAIGRFFLRIGGKDAALATGAYDEWAYIWRSALPEMRRQDGERRAVLESAYARLNGDNDAA